MEKWRERCDKFTKLQVVVFFTTAFGQFGSFGIFVWFFEPTIWTGKL